MENIYYELPPLEQVTPPVQAARRVVASTLKNSPALRTLAEVVRADDQLFEAVADFTSRRGEFKESYDRPGRNVAPWFAAVARENADLLDTALDAHFDAQSSQVLEKLDDDAKENGFTYFPMLVIGSGPQSQIFVSEITQNRPDMSDNLLVIDKAESVGGTFRSTDGMNFRLNSRTRKQTELPPIPGTTSNLNTLAPGVMAIPDMVTETYPGADTFGRTVRLNHALNGNRFGLGLELVCFTPDQGPASSGLPGQVSAVVRTKDGIEYTIRTDTLIATTGIGEPKLGRFDEATRDLIREQQDLANQGKRPVVMTYADYYKWIHKEKFPFKDIKKMAVIGAGDSGCTAIGTALGYEPRSDGSVIQLDTVEQLTWFGQNAQDNVDFLQNTRARYAQIGLEFPRNENQERAYRIRPTEEEARNIQLQTDENGVTQAMINDLPTDGMYDLVVVATGFEDNGQKWIEQRLRQPVRVDDIRVQKAIDPKSPEPLDTGEIIAFPKGFNIEQLQVLHKEDAADRDGTIYTVSITTNDGITSIGTVYQGSSPAAPFRNEITLGDYCGLAKFEPNIAKETDAARNGGGTVSVLETKEQPQELRSIPGSEFAKLSEAEQLALLQPGSLLFRQRDTSYVVTDIYPLQNVVLIQEIRYSKTEPGALTRDKSQSPMAFRVKDVSTLLGQGLGMALINVPELLDAGTPDSKRSQATVIDDLPPSEVLDRLEEFFSMGAILVNTNQPQANNTAVVPVKMADGTIEVAIITKEKNGYLGLDISRFTAEYLRSNPEDFQFDRVIIPSALPAAPRLNLPFNPTEIRAISTVNSPSGEPIAKQVTDAPIYLVGPAAGLAIPQGVTRLIPDIPENSVGVFISQPRNVALAGRVAMSAQRQDLSQARSSLNETVLENLPNAQKMKILVERKSDLISPAAKRLNPEMLLKLGFGIESRKNKISSSFSYYGMSVTEFPQMVFNVKPVVDNEGNPVLEFSTRGGTSYGRIAPINGTILEAFANNSYVNHAIATMLSSRNVSSLRLSVPFDERGARIDDLQIKIKRKNPNTLRPPLPNTMARQRRR